MKKLLAALAILCLPSLALAQGQPGRYPGLQLAANNTMPLCVSGSACLRYNTGTAALELSLNGGAYATISTGAGGTGTLATVYANGASTADSIMSLAATQGPLVLKDNATPIGTLFLIESSALTAYYTFNASNMTFGANRGVTATAGNASWNFGSATGTFSTSTGTNTLNGNVSLATGKTVTYVGGASTFDASLGSGVFKTTTGNHTFGSATWSVPANLVVTGGSSLTNTIGAEYLTNVADGASSIAFQIRNAATLANATSSFLNVNNNGTSIFNMRPASGDGVKLVDGTGSSSLTLSTTLGTFLAYSTANYSVGSGSTSQTDGTGLIAMTGGTITYTVLAGIPDADGTRAWGGLTRKWIFFGNSYTFEPITSQVTATALYEDQSGNLRFGVDSQGMPSLGSRIEFRDDYRWGADTTIASGALSAVALTNSGDVWKATAAAGALGGFVNGTGFATNYPDATGITITPGTGASGQFISVKQALPLIVPQNLTNLYVATEWATVLSVIGTNNVTYREGMSNAELTSGATDPAHPKGWYFEKLSTDTNWQCVTDDGTTTTRTSSAVPPVASTAQMMRIEYYGSGTSLGALTVKFYIDNTRVCTNTTNVYNTASVFFNYGANPTAAAASQNMAVGPVTIWFNQRSSGLIP